MRNSERRQRELRRACHRFNVAAYSALCPVRAATSSILPALPGEAWQNPHLDRGASHGTSAHNTPPRDRSTCDSRCNKHRGNAGPDERNPSLPSNQPKPRPGKRNEEFENIFSCRNCCQPNAPMVIENSIQYHTRFLVIPPRPGELAVSAANGFCRLAPKHEQGTTTSTATP